MGCHNLAYEEYPIRIVDTMDNVTPLFRSDPIGGSEPVPGCSFNSFCLLFICLFVCLFFFCKSVVTRIPGPTRRADSNRSPVYSDRFH